MKEYDFSEEGMSKFYRKNDKRKEKLICRKEKIEFTTNDKYLLEKIEKKFSKIEKKEHNFEFQRENFLEHLISLISSKENYINNKSGAKLKMEREDNYLLENYPNNYQNFVNGFLDWSEKINNNFESSDKDDTVPNPF